MPRVILYTIVLVVFFAYSSAEASNSINWTFYGPGAAGKMQGPMIASQKDAEGLSTGIRTLDDVRLGRSHYVTLASASVMKGRYYCIGTVTYTSPPGNGGDGKTHTLNNVVGYVHDTGCAFNGTCSCAFLKQFCDGKPRTDKMDIAVGNFNGYSAEFAMNYITKNPNRAPKVWTQIAGLPQKGAAPSATNACGGDPKEEGVPVAAQYIPPSTLAPQNPLLSQLQGQQATQSYTSSPYQSQPTPTGGTSGVAPIPATYVGGAYADPAYYPTAQPVPQPTVATNPILTGLFQQSSATSGIRVVQNVAQTLLDMFTVPAASGTRGVSSGVTNSGSQMSLNADAYETSNISLMTVSQMDAESSVALPAQVTYGTQPRPNVMPTDTVQTNPVSTFVQTSPIATSSLNVQTTNLLSSIISSLRTLMESLVRTLAR